jgi:hypothetical protein
MRLSSFAAALALVSAIAPAAAFAQAPKPIVIPAPAPAMVPPPQDQAARSAIAAEITDLNNRIASDEARMTQLRDAMLAESNAIMRAIKPALAFRGDIVR